MNIYLPDVPTAHRELCRLRDIEARLHSRLDDLEGENTVWHKVYQHRLKHNVRPAIRECVRYLKSTI